MDSLEQRITLTAKMFSNIRDKDGSEKDEVNSNIRIIFEENVCPKTDGKTIYLPTSMNEERLWELLGSLLHECFHIRFTDMNSVQNKFHNNQSLFSCLNALEDMRLNWKALQIFPKTKLFFHSLYCYLAKNKKSELLKEPITFQIIKTLLLSNDDFPIYSQEAQRLIDKYDLTRFQKIARNAKSVGELQRPAEELFEILNKIAGEKLSEMNNNDLANMLREMKKDLEKKVEEAHKKYSDLNEQLDKLKKKLNELRKEWKRLHRKAATNHTRNRNLESEADSLDQEADKALEQGDNKTASELRDKANHKRKLADGAEFRGNDSSIKMSENEQKTADLQAKIDFLVKMLRASQKELEEFQKHLEDLLKNGESSEAVGFGYNPLPINGLDALNVSDLVYENTYTLPRTLEDVIREVFLKKKEDREIQDEGKRMNRKNLYRIVTDNQDLFEIPIQPFDKTKIAFMLDASGSMGGRRAELVNTAFAYLYNSLQEVLVQEQLDVEIGVWSFDHNLYTLKDFEEEKTGEAIIKKYRPCGGTQILNNLNTVINKMEACSNNEKRVVILLTDAEVSENELITLKNKINFEDTKVVFIGIETSSTRWSKTARDITRELFMDNIQQDSNVVDILTNALVRNL